MPALTVVNEITEVKPGATTLLSGVRGASEEPLVVLAWQRYGRGKSIALPVQDSWTWQMHVDMPLEDMTHEIFWQQMLRWLVSFVPDRVTVATGADRVAPEEPVTVVAEVEDDTYLRINNVDVKAVVTSPAGFEFEAPMDWTVERDGEYRATFTPEERGLYEIRVEAAEGGEFIGQSTVYVNSTDVAREYYEAEMRSPVLRRVADETGGLYYTPDNVASLPDDISYTDSGTTVIEERDLWDMPIIFLSLFLLISAEWGYRRFRGLV